jgi:hypothetical protein
MTTRPGERSRREIAPASSPGCAPTPTSTPSVSRWCCSAVLPTICCRNPMPVWSPASRPSAPARGHPRGRVRPRHSARAGQARHLWGRLQQPALRRRGHAVSVLPQPARPLRPRLSQRQLPLGPDRRPAAGPRAAPDGIQWPEREPGVTSFKLEHLTAANGIPHAGAHDALVGRARPPSAWRGC